MDSSFLDDYVEGILEKRTPFRAGHLGLAKVCFLLSFPIRNFTLRVTCS